MEFEILNFGVFGLVWLGLHGNGAKNVKFIHQIHRNAIVLKGIKWS